jgi:hypothetical protein
MDAPSAQSKDDYARKINLLTVELQTAVEDGTLDYKVDHIQKKLDSLAKIYQHNEDIGIMRYKLYESQALIYYFQNNDQQAMEFIKTAISFRGRSYPKAERLIAKLEPEPDFKLKKNKKSKNLNGIEGWLVLYLFGLAITIILLVILFINTINVFPLLNVIQTTSPEVYNSFSPLTWYEVLSTTLSIFLAVFTLVFIAKHKKAGKILAIIYMSCLIIFSIVDSAWFSSITASFSTIDFSSAAADGSQTLGRNILYGIIWIPYFIFSKRIKATLVK